MANFATEEAASRRRRGASSGVLAVFGTALVVAGVRSTRNSSCVDSTGFMCPPAP